MWEKTQSVSVKVAGAHPFQDSSLARGCPCLGDRSLPSPMRQELPVAVASRIHPLEPYDKWALFRVPSSVLSSVPSIGDGNVSVKLNLYRVQIAQLVRDF